MGSSEMEPRHGLAMRLPSRLSPGAKVALTAPSAGTAAVFPHVRDRAIEVLRTNFQFTLVIGESLYRVETPPRRRAEELNAFFADPEVEGIICAIGGDDLLRVEPFLDKETIRRNPKVVLGYSDITNLHLMLFSLGIISYYGGNLLCQFGLLGGMQSITQSSFVAATQGKDPFLLLESPTYVNDYPNWSADSDKTLLSLPAPLWDWQGRLDRPVRGILWGGCLECMLVLFAAGSTLVEPDESHGRLVVFFETSEVMPPDFFVYGFVQALGKRGLLDRIAALLVGRPKTECLGQQAVGGKEAYAQNQKSAVLRGLKEHFADKESAETELPFPVVFDMDFGHTDPQNFLPLGSVAEVDPVSKSIRICQT
ncbi:unnamed protein product [Symbiodinium natans]|uniref:LD-carboxypeptidase n=1 Tax=Symbiodinium natans TaxID=878477 RepID=A0A812L7S8_9DINO|nr:unnamed protein product [Symbiodinium natans]